MKSWVVRRGVALRVFVLIALSVLAPGMAGAETLFKIQPIARLGDTSGSPVQHGGNGGLAAPLMESLREKLRGKRVFVITGRATFSAGIGHAAQWKQWGAMVVGEPVGDELHTWCEGGNVELPNSKLTVHYANGFHGYSQREYPDRRPYFADLNVDTLAPDLPAETTWAEYVGGRDPAMERIEGEIAGRASRAPARS